jgi:hypothetical protein
MIEELGVRMPSTIQGCLEQARYCSWYAAHTEDDGDRQFLQRKAEHWTKLAIEKELEVRLFARIAI